ELRDDLSATPMVIERLVPLDQSEHSKYGLGAVSASLAYRYDQPPYRAQFLLQRIVPRVNARTYSFLKLEADAIAAHYEIAYQVSQARVRSLAFDLPASTPRNLSIR